MVGLSHGGEGARNDPAPGTGDAAGGGADATVAMHLVIHGRVQRVGFRRFVQRTAIALELLGWVRNRRDGSVEVAAVGARPALAALHRACATGPKGARVSQVDVLPTVDAGGRADPAPPIDTAGPFGVLPDA